MKQIHLDYLDKLRKSGITNMFAAEPYLIREFSLSTQEVREILIYWMNNFDESGTKLNDP